MNESIPRFPPEIQLSILDQLELEDNLVSEDRWDQHNRTLRNCALTCKLWGSYTYSILHRYLTIRDDASLRSRRAELEAYPDRRNLARHLCKQEAGLLTARTCVAYHFITAA